MLQQILTGQTRGAALRWGRRSCSCICCVGDCPGGAPIAALSPILVLNLAVSLIQALIASKLFPALLVFDPTICRRCSRWRRLSLRARLAGADGLVADARCARSALVRFKQTKSYGHHRRSAADSCGSPMAPLQLRAVLVYDAGLMTAVPPACMSGCSSFP